LALGVIGQPTPLKPKLPTQIRHPNGKPISPDVTVYTDGPISWPMMTVPDLKGNIWIADCASDSVTVYPKGKRSAAFDVPFPHGGGTAKPLGVAIDQHSDAWVTATLNSTMAVYGPNGNLIQLIPSVNKSSQTQLSHPVGIASDLQGNIWVANSDWLDPLCPPGSPNLGAGKKSFDNPLPQQRRTSLLYWDGFYRRRPHATVGHSGRRQPYRVGG
jgi:hypothetical protein